MPAYFNNTVYYGPWGSPILTFTITNAKLTSSAIAQPQQLSVSGGNAEHLGQRHKQRHRLDLGGQHSGSITRLRCNDSKRALQR